MKFLFYYWILFLASQGLAYHEAYHEADHEAYHEAYHEADHEAYNEADHEAYHEAYHEADWWICQTMKEIFSALKLMTNHCITLKSHTNEFTFKVLQQIANETKVPTKQLIKELININSHYLDIILIDKYSALTKVDRDIFGNKMSDLNCHKYCFLKYKQYGLCFPKKFCTNYI